MAMRTRSASDQIVRYTGLPPAAAFSMLGWFYPVNVLGNCGLLTYGTGSTAKEIYINGSNLRLWTGVTSANSSVNLADRTWCHIAVTYDGATLRGYADGVLVVSVSTGTAPSGGPLAIANDAGGSFLDGRWTAIKIYGAVLAADDIRAEMRQYLPVRRAQLNGFYPARTLLEALFDQSGNNNHFVTASMLLEEPGPPGLPWGAMVRNPKYWPRQRSSGTTVPVTPARLRWQGGTRPLRVGLVVSPSRARWQAGIGRLPRVVVVTPARVRWRAQMLLTRTNLFGRNGIATSIRYPLPYPSTATLRQPDIQQLTWNTTAPLALPSYEILPARLQWAAQDPHLGKVVARPGRLEWRAQPLQIGVSIRVATASMRWRTQVQSQIGVAQTTPMHMRWRAQVLAVGRGLLVSRGALRWQAQIPRLGRGFAVRAAATQWRAQSIRGTYTLSVQPARVRWRGQTPLVHRILRVGQAQVRWQAQTLRVVAGVLLVPSRVRWRASTPGVQSALVLMPARVQWQVQSLPNPTLATHALNFTLWKSIPIPDSTTMDDYDLPHASWQYAGFTYQASGILVGPAQMRWGTQDTHPQVRRSYPFRQQVWRRWRY